MNSIMFVLIAVLVLEASESGVYPLDPDHNPKKLRQLIANGFVKEALKDGFYPNPKNEQEITNLIQFHSEDAGYWTAYCANQRHLEKHVEFKPNFHKIKEKSNEKSEDPRAQEKWRKAYNEMRKILHPKAVKGKTSLLIKTTFPNPLTEQQNELSWLMKKVEENPGNSSKKKQKLHERKKKITDIKSLMNFQFLKLAAQKATKDAVIASFFKLKIAQQLGNVKYVMKASWYDLMRLSSLFVFSFEHPVEEPESLLGPYPFATRFKIILNYIRKIIQNVAPENEIEYYLIDGETSEVPFKLQIPSNKIGIQNDLCYHFQHIASVPKVMISINFKVSRVNQIYDVYFFGEKNQLNYFLYIFELLYECLLDEDKSCVVCYDTCATLLLHEFEEIIGKLNMARDFRIITVDDCKKYVKYQMKNDEHRLCHACFLDWFKERGNTNCPKCRTKLTENQIKDLEAEFIKIM